MMLSVPTAIQGTSVQIKEPQSAAYVQQENGAQRGLALVLIVRQGNGVGEEPPSVASVQQVISQFFPDSKSRTLKAINSQVRKLYDLSLTGTWSSGKAEECTNCTEGGMSLPGADSEADCFGTYFNLCPCHIYLFKL